MTDRPAQPVWTARHSLVRRADLPPSTCCHTFRAAGITAYLGERENARARAVDCRPGVAQDDEALRPDGGHDLRRRDRTHRDLAGAWAAALGLRSYEAGGRVAAMVELIGR